MFLISRQTKNGHFWFWPRKYIGNVVLLWFCTSWEIKILVFVGIFHPGKIQILILKKLKMGNFNSDWILEMFECHDFVLFKKLWFEFFVGTFQNFPPCENLAFNFMINKKGEILIMTQGIYWKCSYVIRFVPNLCTF